jgi:type IV secretory pathway VirB9-like protein
MTGKHRLGCFGARDQARCDNHLRYTSIVVLPEGEEILDVLAGDKDWWVISATHNIAHVKPAKAGRRRISTSWRRDGSDR